MGSRKKSKNNSTSTNAAQMAALQRANPGATMGQMMGAQKGMQNNMLRDAMGAFNQMKQAGDAQMAQNPMQAVMAEMMGMGQMSDNDIASAMDMFDVSGFERQGPAPQPVPMPQVTPPNNSVPLPQTTPNMTGGFGGFSAKELEHLRGAMNRRNGFTGNQ
jgi:hypothetical protein